MERTCHLDILPLIIGMLTIWQSLILNAALRSAICRYSEISSLIRQQNAIMLASIDADVVRGKTKFMFWNSSQWNWFLNKFQQFLSNESSVLLITVLCIVYFRNSTVSCLFSLHFYSTMNPRSADFRSPDPRIHRPTLLPPPKIRAILNYLCVKT